MSEASSATSDKDNRMSHRSTRRALAGVRAIGQGALGVALIALAALAFLPSAHAARCTHVVEAR